MPPRVRVTKEQVLNTAFAMTRESGFSEVTARKLAARLNSSTQPIFRVYESMESLKRDLFYMSADFFADKMKKKKLKDGPVYVSLGIGYIELAKSERNLFELIACLDDFEADDVNAFLYRGDMEELLDRLPDETGLSREQRRELLLLMWMFSHGIATLVTGKRVSLNDKELRRLLTKAYDSFRAKI